MSLEAIEVVFKILIGGALGHFWWEKRESKKKMEKDSERITRLEERHSNLYKDVSEIKEDTKDIKKSLSRIEILAVQNSARRLGDEDGDS